MTTIWKYPLQTTDRQIVKMPGVYAFEALKDAEILCLQVQGETPCIWVLVDPATPISEREFRTYGTGHPIESKPGVRHYVGSYQLLQGSLVFHVFEEWRSA